MRDIGQSEFQEIRHDVEAERLSDALVVLRKYRDEAEMCAEGLEKLKVDAERHPSGFKELQISVQESLRRVEGLLPSMTHDEQEPFEEIRKDLETLNQHLIEQLFPRRSPPAAKFD